MNARLLLTPLVAATVLVAACGGSDKTDAPTIAKQPVAGIAVPDDIKAKGTLTGAADPTYPPKEFIGDAGKTSRAGRRPREGDRRVIGLKVEVQNATFDSIIPAWPAVRPRDVVVHRHQGARAARRLRDLLHRRHPATSAPRAARSAGWPTCAARASPSRGAHPADDAEAQSKKCTDAGKAGP